MASARLRSLTLPLAAGGLALVTVAIWGDADLLLQVGVAYAICMLPTVVDALRPRPIRMESDRFIALTRSMIWRMGVTLACSLALGLAFRERFREAFWISLVVCYQVVLLAETWAVLRDTPTAK